MSSSSGNRAVRLASAPRHDLKGTIDTLKKYFKLKIILVCFDLAAGGEPLAFLILGRIQERSDATQTLGSMPERLAKYSGGYKTAVPKKHFGEVNRFHCEKRKFSILSTVCHFPAPENVHPLRTSLTIPASSSHGKRPSRRR
jgi:hypothetical protein